MSIRDIEFVNGQFYHIYNRGVLKSNIFNDSADYARFVHYLYVGNGDKPVRNTTRKIRKDEQGPALLMGAVHKLVDIISWCLIPNHFHMILRQIIEGGIRKFLHKIETGHAMSFNKKYNRSGVLYEGRFEAILIEDDEYLKHLTRYIHLNPVSLIEPGWKEHGIKDWDAVNKFLENYKWSSYMDYLGKHNFPSILNKEPMGWYFKNPDQYKRFVQSWVRKDIDTIEGLTLE